MDCHYCCYLSIAAVAPATDVDPGLPVVDSQARKSQITNHKSHSPVPVSVPGTGTLCRYIPGMVDNPHPHHNLSLERNL
jgi:hypothetical protein